MFHIRKIQNILFSFSVSKSVLILQCDFSQSFHWSAAILQILKNQFFCLVKIFFCQFIPESLGTVTEIFHLYFLFLVYRQIFFR